MNDVRPAGHNIIQRPHVRGIHSVEGDKTRISIVTQCPRCQGRQAVIVPVAGAAAWERGAVIQYALPDLTDTEREALMTGICELCWDQLFSEQ